VPERCRCGHCFSFVARYLPALCTCHKPPLRLRLWFLSAACWPGVFAAGAAYTLLTLAATAKPRWILLPTAAIAFSVAVGACKQHHLACLLSLQWLVCMRCRLIFPWLFDQDVSDQFWFSNYNYFSLLLQASDRAIAHFAAVFFLCRIHSWTIGKTDTFMPGKTYIIRYYLQKLSLMWNNHCKCTENYLQALLIDKNDQSCTVDVWLLQF